ncbi:hypothetical protein ABK040_005233 [Willaertia magna]
MNSKQQQQSQHVRYDSNCSICNNSINDTNALRNSSSNALQPFNGGDLGSDINNGNREKKSIWPLQLDIEDFIQSYELLMKQQQSTYTNTNCKVIFNTNNITQSSTKL